MNNFQKLTIGLLALSAGFLAVMVWMQIEDRAKLHAAAEKQAARQRIELANQGPLEYRQHLMDQIFEASAGLQEIQVEQHAGQLDHTNALALFQKINARLLELHLQVDEFDRTNKPQ